MTSRAMKELRNSTLKMNVAKKIDTSQKDMKKAMPAKKKDKK